MPTDASPAPVPASAAPRLLQTPRKLKVRRPGPTQIATQVLTHQPEVRLADGQTVPAYPGDWLISAGTHTLSVVSAASFPAAYEIVQEDTLTLTRAERDQLERIAGLACTRTPAELIAAVERLATLEIGHVRVEFTPGQLDELKHRATKRGQTVAQAIRAVVDRIHDEIFHRGG